MKLGYVIFYVDDIEATVVFYEKAFGLQRKMLHAGEYAEMDTGATKLAFVPRTAAKTVVGTSIQDAGLSNDPPPAEIAFVTDDVQAAFDKAVAAGARRVSEPAKKPWGQVVSYVRDNNGFLVEICSPVG